MAAPQGNGILMHGEPDLEDGCGCFRSCWFRTQSRHISSYDDDSYLLPEGERRESWVVKQVKKLREVSELIAGPKWKNFIRKVGSYFNNKKRKDFQYDSYNYALNFDNGLDDDDGEDGVALGFSSRFAPPVNDKARSSST